MRGRNGYVFAVLLVALVGCAPTTSSGSETTASVTPSVAPIASAPPSELADGFPTGAFVDINEDRLSEEVATELQAILDDMAGEAGISATVMTAEGTWSGAAGKADGVRDASVDDQFAIASVTKTLIAAQVMQIVEAGELRLDDPVADHLPPHLDFDTNGATIRQLLGMRSGIPEYGMDAERRLETDEITPELLRGNAHRSWTVDELLDTVSTAPTPAGGQFEYTSTNYLLLGLMMEHVRGRPIVEVLRDGVLSIEGVDRLIYQPDEVPTEPMAMPFGESTSILEMGGGFLPSLGFVTEVRTAAAMASDAPSLARWWRAFCAGEIVSGASLTEMTTMRDGYGLGLYEPDPPGSVGHGGEGLGYVSLAGCLPASSVVVVVLSNQMIDISPVARRLVDAVRSG